MGGCIPKLIEIDTPILVDIEHPYHHLDSMHIKLRVVSIHKRLAQLPLRQVTRSILVDRPEKRKQGAVTSS